MHLTGIYHVNINCTNFERSLAFYKMLGFKEVCFEDPDGTVLQLLQFRKTATSEKSAG